MCTFPIVIIQVTDSGDVKVTWSDDHTSQFDWKWLEERRFSQDGRSERIGRLERSNRLWGAKLQPNIPKVDYNEVSCVVCYYKTLLYPLL